MVEKTEFVNAPPVGRKARIGDAEARALEALAKHEYLNISEAVRLAIRETCKSRGLWPPPNIQQE